MAVGRKVYAPEFKRRMVELVRAGRSPEQLAKEFEPSPNTIRKWATQADIDEGLRAEGMTTAERNELRDLRRENKQLKPNHDNLLSVPEVSFHCPVTQCCVRRKASAEAR